ncbi:C39 family peptidase [Thiothrix subterranea]|uniref:C39 family peptidase n=1 Tax=Thiothrix subterranea TaxID=2735563 RepID=UPI00192C76B2|nr:C39 family peptidase [Thiothrix subterranea]QQZ27529.1 C39 family peptidase [Thiothrix subterranea]
MKRVVFVLGLLLASPLLQADSASLHTQTLMGNIPVQSWKALRDARVVKQDKDYSCGAASIATLLTEYYQRPTTEQEVLKLFIDVTGNDDAASFADMEAILPKLGFKGMGLATSWEQLLALKIPVIVYVRQRKEDHFSVLSGISDDKVKLSDPSLGNRILTRGQFKEIWETREEQGLEGKMLAVLPQDKTLAQQADGSFFAKPTFSRVPTEVLTLRHHH